MPFCNLFMERPSYLSISIYLSASTHNEPITTFYSTQNDPSCHKTRFLGSNVTKYRCGRGFAPDPAGKLTSEPLRCGGGKWKEGKNNGKGGTLRRDCSVRNFWLGKLATLFPYRFCGTTACISVLSYYIVEYHGESWWSVRNLFPNRTEFVGIRGVVVL